MKIHRLGSVFLAILTIIALSVTVVDAQYHHVDDCTVCHYTGEQPAECNASPNLMLIRDTVDTPNSGPQPTVFGPYVLGASPYNGVCEVCHTGTAYHRNNVSGDHTHYVGENCIPCHLHSDEFTHGGSGTGCEACHGHEGDSGTAQSHATHTEDDDGYLKGPHKDCDTCHDTQNYPHFPYDPDQDDNSDGEIDLAETEVCDPCHSPGGAFDGVNDPVIGAKANWDTGVYDSQYQHLPNWQANTEYETGDIVWYGDPAVMYAAESTFTSGAAFVPDKWWKITNINWALLGCEIGDLFTTNGQVYRSRIEHTPDMEILPENWELVTRTGAGKEVLHEGKEQWCATCHDDQSANSKADGTGTDAPNVVGNGSTYGFYLSGHGRPGINKTCLDCHNSTFSHIDHEHRTYETHLTITHHVEHAYKDSYRLKESMRIPMYRDYEGGETVEEAMASGNKLCMKTCHEPHAGVLSDRKYCETNFREEVEVYKVQYHSYHLSWVDLGDWDSDWEGTKQDSSIACPACHNVHGSPMMVNGYLKPNPAMTRHGELISTPGIHDNVAGIDIRWFDNYERPRYCGDDETNILADSYGGRMCNTGHSFHEVLVCGTCHGTDGYHRIPGGAAEILGGTDISIWTTDTDPDNTVKTTFYPGEGIRYHMSFYLTGADDGTEFCMQSLDSKAYNDGTMPGADWTDPIDIDTLLPRGPQEMHWDRTIPLTAEAGASEYRMELEMRDATCVTLHSSTGELTHGFTIAAQGSTDPPVRPTLTPRPNIPDLVSASETLEWSAVLCPDGDGVQYKVEVDDDSDFDPPVHTQDWQSGTSWETPDLATGTTWYWRVQARDEVHTDRESDWSYADSFDIFAPLDPPDLTPESDTNDPVPASLDLKWSAVTCPDGHGVEYYAEIGDASDFSGTTYNSGWQSGTRWNVMLPTAATWYWRVKVRDAHNDHMDHESAWSTTDSFVIEGTPTTPTLVPVADDDCPVPVEVSLEWVDDVTCPDGHAPAYMVQVSDCADFDDPPCIQYTSGWQPDIGWNVTLDTGAIWYWRVQAKDSVTGYLSAWSATDAFVITPSIIGESFEGPGYEETWVETVVGFPNRCSLDADYSPIPAGGPPEAGSECLRAFTDGEYKAYAERDCGTPQPVTFSTFYFLVQGEDLVYDQRKSIGYMKDSAGDYAWGFGLYQDTSQLKFNVYLYNNGAWAQAFYDISLNTWYKVDVKYDTVSDTWALQFNGTLVGNGSLIGTHRENIQTWAFGLTDATQDGLAVVYFDKITVRDEWFE